MIDLRLGDSFEILRTIRDSSVDSVVTDPPYGISLIGKTWDYEVPCDDLWAEVLRVLKPGGHLLSFSATRTFHRMAIKIETQGLRSETRYVGSMVLDFPRAETNSDPHWSRLFWRDVHL